MIILKAYRAKPFRTCCICPPQNIAKCHETNNNCDIERGCKTLER